MWLYLLGTFHLFVLCLSLLEAECWIWPLLWFCLFFTSFSGALTALTEGGVLRGGALTVIDCLRVYRFIGKCRYSRTTADVYVWARVDQQLDAGTDPQTGPISCLCHGSEWKGDFLSLLCIVLYCLNSHILTLFEINIPPPFVSFHFFVRFWRFIHIHQTS